MRVVARAPKPNELETLHRAYARQFAHFSGTAKTAAAFLDIGATKRDEQLPKLEHAALAAVCLGIFNLDEALTRE
jgi:hypothetical protein